MGAATSQMAYSAAKAAVIQLSRDLGTHLARRGVRMNALCLGPIETPQLRQLFADRPRTVAISAVFVPPMSKPRITSQSSSLERGTEVIVPPVQQDRLGLGSEAPLLTVTEDTRELSFACFRPPL
jgi:NAD(P)-dependent dehydrogenase (short-subunit alcohol dehydrogenase family)